MQSKDQQSLTVSNMTENASELQLTVTKCSAFEKAKMTQL